jgi:hypothetical protein
VPVLSAVAPNGAHTIDQFEAAGSARALLAPPHLAPAPGYLGIYRRSVQPMSNGAVLIEPGQ